MQEQTQDINQLLKVRRDKLTALQEAGRDPFVITKYNQTHHTDDAVRLYEELEAKLKEQAGDDEEKLKELLEENKVIVSIAGRVMSRRLMGKAGFLDLRDKSGKIQSYVRRDDVGAEAFADYKKGELGPKLQPTPRILGGPGTFTTDTGRLQFYVENPLPRYGLGDSIDYDLERWPCHVDPYESYRENPLAAKYPLLGCSEHRKFTLHSQFAYTPWLRELDPEPFIKLSARDAEERGIKQNDVVKIYNDRGYAIIKAHVTQGVKPGVVYIPHGWQEDQFIEGHTQDLTSTQLSQMDCNSNFYDFLCQVERYEGR